MLSSDELNLSNKQLTSLPPELGQLSNLRLLDLSYNQLPRIPPQVLALGTNIITEGNPLAE